MVFAVCLVVAIAAFFAGVLAAGQVNMRQKLRELGFTGNSAKLYHRAAKLLKQLVEKTEFEGEFGADVLSPETEKRVRAWLADYRQEINR
jgi:hypothetical protein